MKAMVIEKICNLKEEKEPLRLVDIPIPATGDNEILVKVSSCGVCHTELDEIEGRTPPLRFPVAPGHQIIGTVVKTGKYTTTYKSGDRVGIAWIHSACGVCRFCRQDNENLCDRFEATGRDVHGGYAEFTSVLEEYAYPIPDAFNDVEAAPLLCAGTIGYRSLRLTEMRDGENVGLIGFGASAHLVLQMILHKYPSSKIFVFARNEKERAFAKKLGAYWAGDTIEKSPEKLHRAIDTTPVWGTIVNALENLEKGGRLIINAIRKENIDKQTLMEIDYPNHLWFEKEIKSVANVTGRDVREFLALAAEIPIKPEVRTYKLEDANKALVELKEGNIQGAKVLTIA
jgi:alcohol dehydrogenase, propanol-preferring